MPYLVWIIADPQIKVPPISIAQLSISPNNKAAQIGANGISVKDRVAAVVGVTIDDPTMNRTSENPMVTAPNKASQTKSSGLGHIEDV